jgi:hypothetical protein
MPGASWSHASALGLVTLLVACASQDQVERATQSQPITGGTDPVPGDEAVVYLASPDGVCCGALVAPNLVVTTAHCVSVLNFGEFRCSPDGDLETDGSGSGELGRPLDPSTITIHGGSPPADEPLARGSAIVSTETLTICRDDLAFVVLDRRLDDRTPLPLRLEPRVQLGEVMSVVGYGMTGVSNPPELRRRDAVRVLDVGVPPRTFALGPGACPGDSGSPALSTAGGITGIHSIISGDCTSPLIRNTYTELAPYADLVSTAFEQAGATPRLEQPTTVSGAAGTTGCSLTARAAGANPALVLAGVLAGAALRRFRTRRSPRLLRLLATLWLVLSLPLPLFAQTANEAAAEHFDRALAHADRREFTLAIEEFERSYELGNHYSVLYNLGLSYAAIGRYREARDTLGTYLTRGAAELSAERVRGVRSLIEEYQDKVATLRIVTAPAAARISIDGRVLADGSRVEVDPGRHVITARSDGYSEATVVIETGPSDERTLSLELRALSPPVAPIRAAAPRERSAHGGEAQRIGALVLGGVGIAAFGVAAGFGVAANSTYQDSVEDCPNDRCNQDGFETRQRAFDRARIASVAFAVGAGAVAGAGVLWLTAPKAAGTRVGLGGSDSDGFNLRLERRW